MDLSVCGTSQNPMIEVVTAIETPPIRAVGFVCQRSALGRATTPKRRASARTVTVRMTASENEAAMAMIPCVVVIEHTLSI